MTAAEGEAEVLTHALRSVDQVYFCAHAYIIANAMPEIFVLLKNGKM